MRLGQLRSFVVFSERPLWVAISTGRCNTGVKPLSQVSNSRVLQGRSLSQRASPLQATIDYWRNRGHAYPIFVNFDVGIYDFRHFSIMLTILSRGRGSRHHYDT